jgi:hypothetical protein
MSGPGYTNYADGFLIVRAHASGDFIDRVTHDAAVLFGSSGDDRYDGWQDRGILQGAINGVQYANEAGTTFPEIHVISKRQGRDEAYLHGTSAKDRFYGTHVYGRLTGPRDAGGAYFHRVVRFAETYVTSGGGTDAARLVDSPYDDALEGAPGLCVHHVGRFDQTMEHFPTVIASAIEGGADTAELSHYVGDTVSEARDWTAVKGDDYLIRVEQYETVDLTPMAPGRAAEALGTDPPIVAGERREAAGRSNIDLASLALARAATETGSGDDTRDRAVDETMEAQLWWLDA